MPKISAKALKQAIGRYTQPEVESILELLVYTAKVQGRRVDKLTPEECFAFFSPRPGDEAGYRRAQGLRVEILRLLFQDSAESQAKLQRLVQEVEGVSEPATVPRQTPQARVTPGVVGQDGDREKHQLS